MYFFRGGSTGLTPKNFSLAFLFIFLSLFPLPLFLQKPALYESLVCWLAAAALRWIYTTSGEYEEREKERNTRADRKEEEHTKKLQIRKPTASSRKCSWLMSLLACLINLNKLLIVT